MQGHKAMVRGGEDPGMCQEIGRCIETELGFSMLVFMQRGGGGIVAPAGG